MRQYRAFGSLLGGLVCAGILILSLALLSGQESRSEMVAVPAPNVVLKAPSSRLAGNAVEAKSKAKLCECGADCQCGPNCCCDDLASVAAKATAERKPLLIWVGQASACESRLADFTHAHVKEYRGESGAERDPKVIVGRPDGKGGFIVAARILGCPHDLPSKVRLAVGQSSAGSLDDPTYDNPNPYNRNPHWPYQSAQPVTAASCGAGG